MLCDVLPGNACYYMLGKVRTHLAMLGPVRSG
jgi:hypothetical protein